MKLPEVGELTFEHVLTGYPRTIYSQFFEDPLTVAL